MTCPTKDWGGFHKIEQALWVDGSTAGLDPEVTEELNEHVELLANLVKDVELQPAVDRQWLGRAAERGVELEDHR